VRGKDRNVPVTSSALSPASRVHQDFLERSRKRVFLADAERVGTNLGWNKEELPARWVEPTAKIGGPHSAQKAPLPLDVWRENLEAVWERGTLTDEQLLPLEILNHAVDPGMARWTSCTRMYTHML